MLKLSTARGKPGHAAPGFTGGRTLLYCFVGRFSYQRLQEIQMINDYGEVDGDSASTAGGRLTSSYSRMTVTLMMTMMTMVIMMVMMISTMMMTGARCVG